jgi:hypothetical protein
MAALGFQSETVAACADDSGGENVAITVHAAVFTR